MSYRYLGNKTRIADWIVGLVAAKVPPGSVVADPMCGTAAMSAAFAKAGYVVVAGDELRFPVLHAQARLFQGVRDTFEPFGFTYAQAVEHLNNLPPASDGLFTREYSDRGSPANGARPRAYFTGQNAGRIDAIRAAIRSWRRQGLNGLAADLLLHDVILAANRVANIAGTYGYYRSSWSAASLAPLVVAPSRAEQVGAGHRVIQGKADETVGHIQAEAVYLDPPYTKRQYGGNYHILETLALEDDPEPVGDGGLRAWQSQASDFCYRRRARRAFEAILDKCKCSWVFVSYSEDAHLSGNEMLDLLRSYGNVERYEQPLDRYRSNARVARDGAVREHLYSLELNNARPTKSGRNLVAEAESQ